MSERDLRKCKNRQKESYVFTNDIIHVKIRIVHTTNECEGG